MGCGENVPGRFELVEQLDAQLAAVAREEAGLRLRLGQVLEVMQRKACCCELGFSSLASYTLERCERSTRWVEVACCLARRLEGLPLLRSALAMGRISWSKAELLARVAQPESEGRWLELAGRHTLRELRLEVSQARVAAEVDAVLTEEREPMGVLTCTLEREDVWLLEAMRTLLEQLGTRGAEAQIEALLAEGQGALLAALPAEAMELDPLDEAEQAQRRWREQLACWRNEAEARCEPRIRAAVRERTAGASDVAVQAARGLVSLERCQSCDLDSEVRKLAGALAQHELKLSRLLLCFHRADGWRRLGFATETQYARERLGLSRSSVMARRSLALRLEALPHVAAALGRAEVGVEAALQLVRIATPQTERPWLERARQRTVKHLREEVSAALMAVRISGEADCPPPEPEEIEGFQELERAVLSGEVWGGTPNRPQPDCTLELSVESLDGARGPSPQRPWHEMLSSLTAWFEQGALTHAVQMSAPTTVGTVSKQSAGRVEVRWRVSLGLRTWWHALEARARRFLPRGMSWVKFLCLAFWKAWGHLVGGHVACGRVAWGQVYLRDRCRCSSPVCNRRDVTPHHLKFRSAGGGDADDNMTSLCTWCHLFGVHGGRIRATGKAGNIRWELGAREAPCVRVEGRQRLAVSG